MINNQYEGKKAYQVWDEWVEEQRSHFMSDHGFNSKYSMDDLVFYDTCTYEELPKDIRDAVVEHISEGQYARGGKTKMVKSPYSGKTAEEVWGGWTPKQRWYFLLEHEDKYIAELKKRLGADEINLNKLAKLKWHEINEVIQSAVKEYILDWKYSRGGKVEGMWNKFVNWLNEEI